MRIAKLKAAAVVLASAGLVGLAGVGTYTAWGQDKGTAKEKVKVKAAEPPQKKAEPTAQPRKEPDQRDDSYYTAYPDIKRPPDPLGVRVTPWPVDPPAGAEQKDRTYRSLLQNRLLQSFLQVALLLKRLTDCTWSDSDCTSIAECLSDMTAAAAELYANSPDQLVAWLTYLIEVSKEVEDRLDARAKAGAVRPDQWKAAMRHRLAIEAALWKTKNPPKAK